MQYLHNDNPNWPFPPTQRYYGPPKKIFIWDEDTFWYVVFPITFLVTIRYVLYWIGFSNGYHRRYHFHNINVEIVALIQDVTVHLIGDLDFDQ